MSFRGKENSRGELPVQKRGTPIYVGITRPLPQGRVSHVMAQRSLSQILLYLECSRFGALALPLGFMGGGP